MSGVKIPAFDNTLGALFIGSSIATILYGIICLQTFLYITSARGQEDSWWLKTLVYLLFALDSAHQVTMTASIYKFLVSDYLDPLLLPSAGPRSGEEFTLALASIEAISILLVQLFFCWRIWMFSKISLKLQYRLLFTWIAVSLSLLSFGSSIDLSVQGFRHRILTTNTPSFILAYKLSASTRVSFDVMVTLAMTLSLQRARSSGDIRNPRTDHLITILTLFTVNTNLITTCLSISELVTFLTLPKAAVYGGLGFLSIKTYFNSLLAVLNSRDYLREKFDQNAAIITTSTSTNLQPFLPQHNPSMVEGSSSYASAGGTGTGTARGTYDLSTTDQHNLKPSNNKDGNIHGVNTTVQVREDVK
jgi:hypothetical protein